MDREAWQAIVHEVRVGHDCVNEHTHLQSINEARHVLTCVCSIKITLLNPIYTRCSAHRRTGYPTK